MDGMPLDFVEKINEIQQRMWVGKEGEPINSSEHYHCIPW